MLERENLLAMHVYDLRVFAKQCGVKAPSSKTKAQIVNEIFEIKKGEMKPIYNNKGRRNRHYLFELKDETIYDYYRRILSDKTEVFVTLNIDNKEDFLIYLEDLIKESFLAEVTKIKNDKYRLDFKNDTIFIDVV